MKLNYFFLLCLIPVLFIVIKVLMINNIDKKFLLLAKNLPIVSQTYQAMPEKSG